MGCQRMKYKVRFPKLGRFPSRGISRKSFTHLRGVADVIRNEFDESYYLSANPAVREANIDPLIHFAQYGWTEGRNPSPNFSVKYYLEKNPDVRDAGINPFWHYIVKGRSEGRSPQPASGGAKEVPGTAPEDGPLELMRGAFDSKYYLRNNPDVAESGVDPLQHFSEIGWKEKRDPTPQFSVEYYLEANPDVQEAGINPFWHYLVRGRAEGRSARHPGGFKSDALLVAKPLEEVVNSWRRKNAPDNLVDPSEILEHVRAAEAGGSRKIIISVGHDNYREVSGGVQYCIQHEEVEAIKRGIVYLNLHPYKPIPRLSHNQEVIDVPVSLVLNGRAVGVTLSSSVAQVVEELCETSSKVEVVIHHLMGHSLEQIATVVQATGDPSCKLWLHDFFTLCPSYVLQRNNVSYCAAPPVASNACELCLFGRERVDHLERVKKFFETIEVDVIAPSRFAADFWLSRTTVTAAKLSIAPHANIIWSDSSVEREENARIRIAFVGYPAMQKGWPVFREIVETLRDPSNGLEFLYFGNTKVDTNGVAEVAVHVTAEKPNAMIDALDDYSIDFVIHWASWGETFSFSTYEAIASGAYVITNALSGNVAAAVAEFQRGVVLDSVSELKDFLTDGRAKTMAKEVRRNRQKKSGTLVRSNISLDLK